MPRNGSGVYSRPSGTAATANETATAAQFNDSFDDVATDLNTARPISVGGTGATSASAARTNLGLGALATLDAPADDSLTTAMYQDDSVTGPKVAAGAIDTEHLAGEAVTEAKVDPAFLASLRAKNDRFIASNTQPSGSDGGSSVSSTWTTITLNTSDVIGISGASLSASVITLPAGTYRVSGQSPAYASGAHQARIRDITNSLTLALGTAEGTDVGAGVSVASSFYPTEFTISGSTDIELQHWVASSRSTDGFGKGATNGEVNRFATIIIEQVS